MVNGKLVVSASAGALTIAVKTDAGADPSAGSPVIFRIPDPAGGYTNINVTSAMSLVVVSGATLGVTANNAFRIWMVAFNDGGTVRLGVIRASSEITISPIYPLGDSAAGRSSTVMNTASDSAGVIYSNPAVASKPMRVLGYIEWNPPGLAAAPGTWTTTNLRCVQLMGLGVRLPGHVVQTTIVTDSTTYTTTGLTKVAATSTAGMNCFDPCNPMKIRAQGILWPSAGAIAFTQVFRGGAAGTGIGGMMEASDAGGGAIISGVAMAWDFPQLASTTAFSYSAVFWASSDLVRFNPHTIPLTLIAEEIMG
jgi:hypothetical protein